MELAQIYRNIKQLRLEKGWSQTDLAKRTGYSDKSMIAKIENGKVDLTQSKIIEFANALGTTPSELMGWTSDDDAVNEMASAMLSHDEDKKLIAAYHRADDITKEMVRRILGI